MVQIKIKSEAHLEALDALRELFANAMDEGIDPDIFMESCLCFALAYHLDRDWETISSLRWLTT